MFQEEELVKKTKICEQGSNQESLEDRLSQLPEELICCNILSRLRTVDAVKTSALSTNWRHLWKRVPHLGLHSRRFSTTNDLVTFINKFLYSRKDSLIRKFQLRIYDWHFEDKWLDALYMDDDVCYVTQWIDDLLTRHKIQHLDFSFGNSASYWIVIRRSLYSCETLVHLRLVGIDELVDSEFVSLPCLKSIYLRNVTWPNVTILEKFISNSPVLEDLTLLMSLINNDDAKPLHLRSQTLERISVDDLGARINVVVIDAPLLQCFKIKREIFVENTITIYSGVSPKVEVHVKIFFIDLYLIPDDSMIRDNLINISIMVKDLVITRKALKHFYLFSKLEPLPQFGYMSCLNVNLCVSLLKWFPTFLESCPNLKSLSMRWHASSKKKRSIRFESVPKCLLSSLECVDIKTMVSEDAIEVKVVKYFLDNAVVLKKLTLKLNSHPRKDDIFNEILKLPRRSMASQLELL